MNRNRDKVSKSFSTPVTTSSESYVRPSCWLTLPNLTAGQEKVVGLYAVYNTSTNYCSLLAKGNYTVDWGDGVVENFTSNTQANHIYNYADLVGTDCVRGYRQAIVTITPQAGQQLTEIQFDRRHASRGAITYNTGWLDVKVVGSNFTLCKFYANNSVTAGLLEQFEFVGLNNISNFTVMFYNCYSLERIVALDTSKATTLQNFFGNCRKLKYLPYLKTSLVTDFSNMFTACTSLEKCPLFDTSKGTNFTVMFNNCYELKSVPLFDTSKGTNFSNMFVNCYELKSVPLLNTSLGTNFGNMFNGCRKLRTIPLIDTSKGTLFSYFVSACTLLETIPLIDTSKATTFFAFFNGCSSLKSLPLLDTGLVTDFSYVFQGSNISIPPAFNTTNVNLYTTAFSAAASLSKLPFTSIKATLSLLNCKLGRAELVEVFNSLVTIAGQTLTITGNPGVSSLSVAEKAIATGKGWTLVL